MTDRELMQQALDALDIFYDEYGWGKKQQKAHEALRARLAQPEQEHSEQWWKHEVSNAYANGYEKGRASVKQPEQEPVAWMHIQGDHQDPCFRELTEDEISRGWTQEPLYTAPPQREWQGLTDEEANELTYASIAEIEAKLKEKNHG